MSLIRGGAVMGPTHVHARWVPLRNAGAAHPAGQMTLDSASRGLDFVLSETAQSGVDVLACYPCDYPAGGAFMRIDEVCFPVGAVAHRHTHTGAGIRHLVRGSLRLEADDHTQTMNVGDSWFEAANSPVRAVSLHEKGVASFLRAMVIPAEFEGKSTFTLSNPDDAQLPRLQVTHRHIDLPL
ncbi:cupin domain-containing protein [Shimia sp.]|uniref:cupin domain-containing protein n=1 Tax=Shimia sp. TaxID=1954381 RepID=UPI003298FD29